MTEKKLTEKIEVCINKEYMLKGTFEPSEIAEKIASMAIEYFRTIHSRALACHCECLGMNAENSLAVCNNQTLPYSQQSYEKVMFKWNLINEKGEPLI